MNQEQVKKTNNVSNNQTKKSKKKKRNARKTQHLCQRLSLTEYEGPTITGNNKELWQSNRAGNKKDSKVKRGNTAIVTFSTKD